MLFTWAGRFYFLMVRLAALVGNAKARAFVQGRTDWQTRLAKAAIAQHKPIWVHCASLGEFEQGRPVMEAIKAQYPQQKILLTFFSPSGYEVRKNYTGADWVFYLPVDSPTNAKSFLTLVNPSIALFIKYEFWACYLNELKKNQTPTFLVSGIFRPQQHFFKWYGNPKLLQAFTHYFVQNDDSARLLQGVGYTNTTVCGDTRTDRVLAITQLPTEMPLIQAFAANHTLIVAGSTWPTDMEILAPYINNAPANFRFIIAPHNVTASELAIIKNQVTQPLQTLSNAETNGLQANTKVLVVDSVGILAQLYRYATITYVGGGFGTGIHNVLEAAVWGKPVVFGPNHQRFAEAVELKQLGVGYSISSFGYFQTVLTELNSPEKLDPIATQAQGYFNQNKGATQAIVNHLIEGRFLG